jgi:hypothetical protein
MRVDDAPVAVVQEEVARQLLLCGLAGEAGVTRPLVVGKEIDRQCPSFLGGSEGEVFAKLTRFAKKAELLFFGGFSFAKVCRKR